jgi:carbamoyltransferase
MQVLGLSAYYHDSAAALVRDGQIVAAAEEERFTRRKHDDAFPHHSVAFCLSAAGGAAAVDRVVFYEKPFLKFERLLETYLEGAPKGFPSFRTAMPVWLRQKLFLRQLLLDELRRHAPEIDWSEKLLFGEHHLSHAASAFYPSPFDDAAILTVDAAGEWTTTSFAVGRGTELAIQREIHFPDSLGLLYSAFTYHCGFKVNSGEYKLMGLAPYGEPRYASRIREHLIDLRDDGSFRLNQQYFDYCTGLRMTNERFDRLFGSPPRSPKDNITQHHMDMAASIQVVAEEAMLRMTRAIATETGLENLCLAGGVALNCVANGKIQRDGRFKRLWVQPAAGDAGGALGAALHAYHTVLRQPRLPSPGRDHMQGSYLGPEYSNDEIAAALRGFGAHFRKLPDEQLFSECASLIAAGATLAWFQGQMEFGPRALGARSILADPRNREMQRNLNLKVKFRESFRPFAPAVLAEEAARWFALDEPSPYMLLVAEVAASQRRTGTSMATGIARLHDERSTVPAVTHVDFSARVQTVHRDTNARFHRLLSEFYRQTGCPVLVNTSFNVRGEPIVASPTDAYRCFMGSGVEYLALGNFLVAKAEQPHAQPIDYVQQFSPD